MVSPWQKNGDALSYVKANDMSLDYIAFVSMVLCHSLSRVNETLADHSPCTGRRSSAQNGSCSWRHQTSKSVVANQAFHVLMLLSRQINVLVSDQGLPLLSDFGLSKVCISVAFELSLNKNVSQIIQDSSGAPLTQSNMMADFCRYSAPEATNQDSMLTPATDVYALGMTILEVKKNIALDFFLPS